MITSLRRYPKPSIIARLPRLPSSVAASSRLSPASVRPVPLIFCLGAATSQWSFEPASKTSSSQIATVLLALIRSAASGAYGVI